MKFIYLSICQSFSIQRERKYTFLVPSLSYLLLEHFHTKITCQNMLFNWSRKYKMLKKNHLYHCTLDHICCSWEIWMIFYLLYKKTVDFDFHVPLLVPLCTALCYHLKCVHFLSFRVGLYTAFSLSCP